MEDKYFDQIFREKFEQTIPQTFDESAWEDLASRLEKQPKRKFFWLPLAAASILLPVAVVSGVLFYQLSVTKQEILSLQKEVIRLKNNKNQPSANPPVASQTVPLPNNPTSPTTTVLRTTGGLPKENEKLLGTKTTRTGAVGKKAETTTFDQSDLLPPPTVENKISKSLDNAGFDQTESLAELSKIKSKLAKKYNDKSYENWIYQENPIALKPNRSFAISDYLLPETYSANVALGAAYVFNKSDAIALTQGIVGAVHFPNNVDLSVGLEYLNVTYGTDAIPSDAPAVRPLRGNDQFTHLTVRYDCLQVPIALKYRFSNDSEVFEPFVKVGGISRKTLQKQHTYEFIHLDKPAPEGYVIEAPNQSLNQPFRLNTVSLALGTEVSVSENLNLQLEVFANRTLANNADLDGQNWTMAGCNATLSYNF